MEYVFLAIAALGIWWLVARSRRPTVTQWLMSWPENWRDTGISEEEVRAFCKRRNGGEIYQALDDPNSGIRNSGDELPHRMIYMAGLMKFNGLMPKILATMLQTGIQADEWRKTYERCLGCFEGDASVAGALDNVPTMPPGLFAWTLGFLASRFGHINDLISLLGKDHPPVRIRAAQALHRIAQRPKLADELRQQLRTIEFYAANDRAARERNVALQAAIQAAWGAVIEATSSAPTR